ncbi:Rieske (2Fe-2S) protein [Arcticibacter eurypsychrophilus]|uniref:Rieske (2Fe-2S) protein n=1 Tax=Arcticibacter eurypsychrophilus TaxID=1434752 RepID=UPI00084DA454|nr:Rieske (2Fe-2S) protein [Arcticibacter eurypsychrophilus]
MARDTKDNHWKEDFPIPELESTQVSRRDFAKFLCLVSGGLATGTGYVAIKANFFPPEKIVNEHFVCKKDELPIGGTKAFVISGSDIPYILIHLEDGQFRSYEQKCTHLSCAVFYLPGSGRIECPCHNGWFDALTGEALEGPPPRPLPRLDVVIKGMDVYVKAYEPSNKAVV